MNRSHKLTLSSSILALMLCAGGAAHAQYDEIVVTAQKTEQNLQEVPLAVSVLSADAIESKYANNIETLQTLVPSVSFRKGTTSANSALAIRGIGTVSFSLAAEPAVSTVVDGVVLGRSGQAFDNLYDIERIEVLRGPQGTLYGKNAQAGVINIVTQKPGRELDGYIDASYFEGNEWKVRGKISGPISDDLSGSLVIENAAFDGHIRNVYNNNMVNGYSRWGARGMLLFQPRDDFEMLFTYEHQEADDDCCADLEVLPSGRNPVSAAAPNSNGIVNGVADLDLDQRRVDHDFESKTINNADAFSVSIDKGFADGHSLVSISSYREWANTELREGDFTSIGGSAGLPVFGVPFLLHDNGTREWTQFSQEFRIQSPQDQDIRYILGGYYLGLDSEGIFTRNASCQNNASPSNGAGGIELFDPTTLASIGFFGQNDSILAANPGLTCLDSDIVSATSNTEVSFDNYAIFGQLDYDLTDALGVFVGLRYTSDNVEFRHNRVNNDPFGRQGVGVRSQLPNPQFPDCMTVVTSNCIVNGALDPSRDTGGYARNFANETEEDNFSVKAGVNAGLGGLFGGDTNLGNVYFTYAQGYKGPGFNTFFNMSFNDTLPIAPETSDSFEVGYKYNAGSLLFNLALYTMTIDDFQANNFDNSTGVTITRLTNAGSVRTRGIEVDASWSPIDNLTLNGALAINDATIQEFNCPIDPTTSLPPANCTDRAGLDLFFSPDVNYTFGFNYEAPISNDTDAFITGTFAHVDDQESLLPGNNGSVNPVSNLPSYNQLDISIGLSMYDGQYRITAIGKNLTDDSFVTTHSGDNFRYHIPREADRYFGVNFRANFN